MTHDRSIRVAVVGGARAPFAMAGTLFRNHCIQKGPPTARQARQ